jgi:dihydrofolate reductase
MIISMIAAMDKNKIIGQNGRLPWQLPADMQRFIALTMGKPVIMGRKTYESIPAKFKPLKGRTNIILSRNPNYEAPGCIVVDSPEAALAAAGDADEVMICGGSTIYKAYLFQADRLYLTIIDAEFKGDTVFPTTEQICWCIIQQETHQPDEKNQFGYQFLTLERKTLSHQTILGPEG